MRIAYVVPGSGGTFYCENCVRDTGAVAALRQRGHDVVLVPMYLPLFTDEPQLGADAPVFFGGVNVYLQQVLPLFRATPRWLDRLLDAPWVLRRAAARAGSTRARDLGPMTLSMLRGEQGHQAKELQRLETWLASAVQPELIHLSNALLLGLGRRLRAATGAALVCSLQDEAPWLDAIAPPYDRQCWELLAERARDVDLLLAVSRSYGDAFTARLGGAQDALRVVYPGVDVDRYSPAESPPNPPAVGYLARLNEGNGLEQLVDAYLLLKQRPEHRELRLRLSGGQTGDDRAFLGHLRRRLGERGWAQHLEVETRFDPEARARFLRGVSVLSVPGTEQTAFGLYILEALATGVPVAQPATGAYPELIETTGGGVTYQPFTADALAAALHGLLAEPIRARELGHRGRVAVEREFTRAAAAARLEAAYREALQRRRATA